MKIEIYNNDNIIEMDNVMFKDYTEEIVNKRKLLLENEPDFSSISLLKGEKTLMELAFQEIKKELV